MRPSELKKKNNNKKTKQLQPSSSLTNAEKQKANEELIQSQGILRDYDNNELLYPLNLTLLDTLERMKEYAKSSL